jgi:hypothetical protein
MKEFIITVAVLIIYAIITVFGQDFNMDMRQNFDLKYAADECSASASLFYDPVAYSEGKIIFEQDKCKQAIDNQMQSILKLDTSFNPLPGSYYQDQITYKVYYYDYSNTDFSVPQVHKDKDTGYTVPITSPTVVITINSGRSRYRLTLFNNIASTVRSGSHTWQER